MAHAVADNPDAAFALAFAWIPAVVIEAVLAGDAVVEYVGMLAGDGLVDLGLSGESEIVAAE